MRFHFALVLLSAISFVAFGQDGTGLAATDSTTKSQAFVSKGESLVRADSSKVQLRSFDLTRLDQLRKDADFDYRQPPSVAESLWDRFILWLDQLFGWILRNAVTTNWGRLLLYTLGLGVLVVIVMMLLKVDALRVFYSGADKGSLNYQAFQENIHEMDFEKLIREALEKKEYRLGVRLTFLYSLKLLSDKHHLDWRPGKTNHDYLDELGDGELKTGFNELSFYFDYAWYGDFTVNESTYQHVHLIFIDWRKKIE